jgi:hypothetical protein
VSTDANLPSLSGFVKKELLRLIVRVLLHGVYTVDNVCFVMYIGAVSYLSPIELDSAAKKVGCSGLGFVWCALSWNDYSHVWKINLLCPPKCFM